MSDNSEEKHHQKSAAHMVSKFGSFVAGGLAACIAVTASNPFDCVKTRMQLQGEMHANAAKVYKNPIQAMGVIFKNEGIKGLQKGLISAYVYQIALNGSRLGLYEPIRELLNNTFYPGVESYKVQHVGINVATGALTGIIGAILGSPLFLIKTRMQAYSNAVHIGEQTHYNGVIHGLRTIAKTEGIPGLFRGVDAAVLRTGIGSAVQLPIYNVVKKFLLKHDIMSEGSPLHLVSSACAGLGVGVVMNPWDVVLTRVYNQKGNLYKGPIDCFSKTIKAEGLGALYKGFGAHLLRIGPHTVLCLTFMEQTMKLVYTVEQRFF